MGLPWRTFAQSQTLMQLLTGSKISTTDIGTLYNLAYRECLESHEWSARLGEAVVNTVDEYSTGTVSVNQDSTTVTGSLTTFTSAMTGRFIRINNSDTFYKVTFVGVTELTLEKAWPYANVSGVSYTVFQYVYTVDPTAGDVGQVLMPNESWPMEERSLAWINGIDPQRRLAGGTARAWIPHGLNSSNAYQIEFWPRFESATSVRIPFYKRVDDLSGSSQPIIRADVIEALALSYCFSHMLTKTGDPQYAKQEDIWEKRYEGRLDTALRADQANHGLPRSVQPESTYAYDHDFYVSHDI